MTEKRPAGELSLFALTLLACGLVALTSVLAEPFSGTPSLSGLYSSPVGELTRPTEEQEIHKPPVGKPHLVKAAPPSK